MALLKNCFCCSLLQGSIITGVYTTVVYLAAFIMELCLVLEGENWVNSGKEKGPLPLPGYILVVLHFTVAGLSIIMLYALYQRRIGVLLAWVFIFSLLFFPELGIVLFLVMFHWEITNAFGLAEIAFYLVRAPVNVICILCVHSLYTSWKNQIETQRSLKKLTSLQMIKDTSKKPSSYKNAGFLGSNNELASSSGGHNGEIHTYVNNKFGTVPLGKSRLSGSMISLDFQKGGSLSRGFSAASQYAEYGNYYQTPPVAVESVPGYRTRGSHSWDPYVQVPLRDTRSEFNASMFPGSMPALNLCRSEQPSFPPQAFVPGVVYNLGPPVGYSGYGGRGYEAYDIEGMTNCLLDPEYPQGYKRQIIHPDYSTQSLDRRRYLRRANSLTSDPFSMPPGSKPNPLYYGYPRHQESKTSIGAESDDFRRYRDVAL